jgi:hypothetical protein
MKLIITTFAIMLALVTTEAKAQLNKDVILQRVMSKSLRLEREFKLFSYEKLSPEMIAQLSGRYKMADAKFKPEFLYYIYTMDDKFKYKIIFNHENDSCLLETTPRELDQHIRTCYQDMASCSEKANSNPSLATPEALKSCYDKSTSCQKIQTGKTLSIVSVDKKYCKSAYGVDL